MRLPGCCCDPPAPAMPRGGSTAPTAAAQGQFQGDLTSHSRCGPNAPEMLVSPPQGHLVLQGERDGGSSSMDKLAVPRGIPWQPGPARLHPVMGAIPPSPLGCQGYIPPSCPSSKTTHGAGLDTSPSRTMHYTGSQAPKQQQQDKVQAARPPQGHIPGASSTAWQVNGPISQH